MRVQDKYLAAIGVVLKLQVLLAIICVVSAWVIYQNLDVLYSSAIGALIAITTTYVYARVAFKDGKVVAPYRALQNHKKAFLIRFMLNFVLFLVTCVFYRSCHFYTLFIVFFVVLSAYWFSFIKT